MTFQTIDTTPEVTQLDMINSFVYHIGSVEASNTRPLDSLCGKYILSVKSIHKNYVPILYT